MSLLKPIKVLSSEVARKIAAGEVIDRPNAIVRELMDNAIDSGADLITVELFGGGIDKIRVIDNGSGMSKEDLQIAATPHATSKIFTEQDLLNLSTLGFRGEALSSIAAVSNLTIISGEYKLETDIIKENKISAYQHIDGAIVQSENLFQNFPARRLFLKRPGTESKMCQTTFIEKALPFYDIEFRLYIDGELKLNFPKTKSIKERFLTAENYSSQKDLFFVLKNAGADDSWKYELIIGEPSVYRNDRKEINVYVNNRKIIEYSLMQAIEYGCQGYFPNGTHPVASLFISINPELVDFNIHPAKKEARFKDINELHHSISYTTQNFFRNLTVKSVNLKNENHDFSNSFDFKTEKPRLAISDSKESYSKNSASSDFRSSFFNSSVSSANFNSVLNQGSGSASTSNYAENLAKLAALENGIYDSHNLNDVYEKSEMAGKVHSEKKLKYYGTALGVFLIAELDDTLYLIDQHAAHERILYNNIMSNISKSQKLLVPYELETQNVQDDSYLESIKDSLEQAGFKIKNCGNGKWQILEVQERWTGTESELQKIILDDKIAPDKILSHIAATTACKAAIKDGYYLDEQTAAELAEKALNLEDPHCPHGRPIWTAITKDKLFELVRRTE